MSAFFAFFLFLAVSYGQAADANSFSLYMTGACKMDSATSGNCTLKGNSQTITTLISPTDALSFTVKNHIGSYAQLTSKYEVRPDGTIQETGAISFGVHQSRDHTIFFLIEGKTLAGPNGLNWGSESGKITGGEGVFAGYTGIIAAAGATGTDGQTFGLVNGHIWKKP